MSLAEWGRLQESHDFEILAGRDDPAWRDVSRFRLRMIEGLTGRNVVAFVGPVRVEPDLMIEVFFIDGPLRGFGALESTET